MAKYDHLKETLYNFYKNNSRLGRKASYDCIFELSAPKRALNRQLVKLPQNKTVDRKKGSGRIEKKATDNQKNVQP